MPITPVQPAQVQGAGPAMRLGQQTYNVGRGLLSNPIAGNGVGQIPRPRMPGMPTSAVAPNSFGFGAPGQTGQVPQFQAPTQASNPYLRGMANDITRRAMQSLGQNNLAIQGNSVASGGLGGSRQGVAQGIAAGQTMDALSGQLAGMYGNAYEGDQGRALQRYGIDTGSYNAQRGQDIAMRGQDLTNFNQMADRGLQQYGMDQNFYGQQRGQDLLAANTGMNLANGGLDMQWNPLRNLSSTLAPFTGFGNTTTSQNSGGGWQGALGGALSGFALGNYFR